MPDPRQFIEVAGLRLAYVEAGSAGGRPVVLLHGALTGLDDPLLALQGALAGEARLIAFDRPGYGGSEGGWESASIWTQAALFRAAFTALDLRRPLLVGHSLGGAAAIAFALQTPEEVAGVVAVSPLAFPEARLEHLLFGPRAAPLGGDLLSFAAMPLDALLMPAVWATMFHPQPVPPAFARIFPTTEAGERSRLKTVARESARLIPDLSRSVSLYAGNRVPVRILCGDRDRVINPLLHGRALAAALPHSRFIDLPGVGHMGHHARPDAVAKAVRDLWDDASPSPSDGA